MSEGSFHRVISEHRALAQRNRRLEATMPLDLYREQYGHRLAYDPRIAPSATAAADELPTEMDAAAPLRRDRDSWWDSSDERPPPAFDWGDD